MYQLSKKSHIEQHTQIIKQIAFDLGFAHVGISKAERLVEEEDNLSTWLKNEHHGEMSYMENYFDKRLDPSLLVPGSKSVISLMYNYYTDKQQEDISAPKISKYAFGKDYHFIIKDKLKLFIESIEEKIGAVPGRTFTDSAPIMERAWAAKSGLGWRGKHTLLINKTKGSYYFLAELILDIELKADSPIQNHCGTCTKCIDACPTDAISAQGDIVDGSKCISYLTIELKDAIPNQFKDKMENWMFGCDICQTVCPWNRFSTPHQETSFSPHNDLLSMKEEEWQNISRETFNEIFRKSPVKRTKFEGLMRNINFLKK